MTELKLYDTYRMFVERVRVGKEKDYILTSRMPLGISVCLGEEPLPQKSFWKQVFYHEERTVVCVGAMDNGRHLFAVRKNWLDQGGKLNNF